jgi:hypothetical protein
MESALIGCHGVASHWLSGRGLSLAVAEVTHGGLSFAPVSGEGLSLAGMSGVSGTLSLAAMLHKPKVSSHFVYDSAQAKSVKSFVKTEAYTSVRKCLLTLHQMCIRNVWMMMDLPFHVKVVSQALLMKMIWTYATAVERSSVQHVYLNL